MKLELAECKFPPLGTGIVVNAFIAGLHLYKPECAESKKRNRRNKAPLHKKHAQSEILKQVFEIDKYHTQMEQTLWKILRKRFNCKLRKDMTIYPRSNMFSDKFPAYL